MEKSQLFCEVAKLAGKYQFTEDLWWDKDLNVSVNVSDLFYWACADAEEVTEENLPVLKQTTADLEAVCPRSVDGYAASLFAARVRNMRPQGKYISDYVNEYPEREKVYNEELKQEVWQTPTDENGNLYYDPQITQALKDLFLALPERPVDIGNPYTPEGKYEYKNPKETKENES